MTRVLSALLSKDKPYFQLELNKLEKRSGLGSVDIRLSEDIVGRTRQKIKQLGLDSSDTTARELFFCLNEKLRKDGDTIAKSIGLGDSYNEKSLGKIKKFLDTVSGNRLFAIKESVYKRILRKIDLAEAKKILGYRSIDSMLKRSSCLTIILALRGADNDNWLRELEEQLDSLKPSDFEQNKLKFSFADDEKIVSLMSSNKQINGVFVLPERGEILISPEYYNFSKDFKMAVFSLVLDYIKAVNGINAASQYLRFGHIKGAASTALRDLLNGSLSITKDFMTQPIEWQLVYRHIAKNIDNYHKKFSSIISQEDFTWHNIDDILLSIDRSLSFWRNSEDCVLVDKEGHITSINLYDAISSFRNNQDFNSRTFEFAKDNIWQSLIGRYLSSSSFSREILEEVS